MCFSEIPVEQTKSWKGLHGPLYLSGAAKGVHVVEDRYELLVAGWVQDVGINFEVLNHHIHQVSAQLQKYCVWPACLIPLQCGSCTVLHL